MSLLPSLHRLMARESLTCSEAREAMQVILRGEATTAQIAAFLVALRMKGETADELTGLAQGLRDGMTPVATGITDEPVLDIVGTGGDGHATLNVSTLAALVVAACGVKVAKHGNRSITSRCGSADLMEQLGVNLQQTPERLALAVREVGFAFLFAPLHHPALKHAGPARAELKTRTAFNLLGPLANPAAASVQVVGCYSAAYAELMAVALSSLGLQRGAVVCGEGGIDEVTTTGETRVLRLMRGAIDSHSVLPEDFGLRRAELDELRGGDPERNAQIARGVLEGRTGAFRDVVVANAALALVVVGKSTAYREGAAMAAEALSSGAAARVLARYVEFTARSSGA